jgi:2-succinyl-5-enolpyruvyl-6-hydroxy-3-cyclohexene-1-carboxylate synthase
MSPAPSDVQATFCATLIDEWVGRGLRHAVVAPGSRSTPMALALAARTDISIEVFHDERSASFAALGIALATGVPAALLCTSGTAATHFPRGSRRGSPVRCADAGVDGRPSARTARRRRTADDRASEPVRHSATLVSRPGVADDAQRTTWRSVASRAWLHATGDKPGPVHLNLPFREPLVGVVGELPEPDPDELQSPPLVDVDDLVALLDEPHGVIVAGNGVDDPTAVQSLAEACGWPVLADPLSGCQMIAEAVVRFDAILRHTTFAASNRPAVVFAARHATGVEGARPMVGRVRRTARRGVAGRVGLGPQPRRRPPGPRADRRALQTSGIACPTA